MKNIKTYENYNKVKTISDYIDLYYDESILLNITFSCSDNFIESLDGIEKFTQLEEFYCSQNKITSLKGIENLTKLEFLFFTDNKITSLKPILNLTKLKHLYCDGNPINWVDYIDKQGRTYYVKLPKSIENFKSDNFGTIEDYWEFYDQNQPSGISRKFNF